MTVPCYGEVVMLDLCVSPVTAEHGAPLSRSVYKIHPANPLTSHDEEFILKGLKYIS